MTQQTEESPQNPPNKLDGKTLIPLSLVLTIAGGAFWLSTMYLQAKENTRSIIEIKQERSTIHSKLIEISERLSRIEGHLDK